MSDNGQLVTSMRVQNFACVRDVQVELTALHAFIGPRDAASLHRWLARAGEALGGSSR